MLYLLILTVLSKSFELRSPVDKLEIEGGDRNLGVYRFITELFIS